MNKPITLSLPVEMIKELKEYSKKTYRTMSDTVRMSLEKTLKE